MTKDETDLVESASKSIGNSSQASTAETKPPLVLGDRDAFVHLDGLRAVGVVMRLDQTDPNDVDVAHAENFL